MSNSNFKKFLVCNILIEPKASDSQAKQWQDNGIPSVMDIALIPHIH